MRAARYWIFFLFVFAFILRFYPIPHDLFFGPEQGRDMLAARRIVTERKFTLIGAKTDIDGIFHGPLFYYFLTLPYIISGGSPVGSAFFTILINTLSIVTIYQVGKTLFSQRIGMVAALLSAISYRAIEYTRWFSAPALIPVLVPLFLLALWHLVNGKRAALYWTALLSGMLIQLQLLNVTFVLPIVLITVIWSKAKLSSKHVIASTCLFAFTISTFFLFDLRHEFLMSKNILAVMVGKKGFSSPVSVSVRETSERFAKEVELYSSPGVPWLGWILLALGYGVVLRHLQKPFGANHLALTVFSVPLIILATSRHSVLSHFFIFVSPMIFLIAAQALDELWKLAKIVVLVLLIIIVSLNGRALLSLKPWGITIKEEKKIIDTIYRDASGKPFRYEAFTFPYFWKDAWEYMFTWYGKPRYGYIPQESGVNRVYFIWEEEGTPYQKFWYTSHVVPYGDIVMRWATDSVHVERREKPQPDAITP